MSFFGRRHSGRWASAYVFPIGSGCGGRDADAPHTHHNRGCDRGGAHWGGGPWACFAGRSRFFEGGEVRLAILSLLAEGLKHGYQLMKELKERSGGMYRASAGTVYPTLQMLEDEGLIQLEQQEGRRAYRITVAGTAELNRDPETVRKIWERAGHWEDWSQYAGPEIFAFASPMASLLTSMMRSAKWDSGNEERDAKVRELIRKLTAHLDELSK